MDVSETVIALALEACQSSISKRICPGVGAQLQTITLVAPMKGPHVYG